MQTVNSRPPLLAFSGAPRTARLDARRKRFLMDVQDDAGAFTAHTNNTGSMLGLLRPGAEVLLSESAAPGRKYPCTVEAVKPGEAWVGVNTSVPTKILRAAWEAGLFAETSGYATFTPEPRFAHGRLDALFSGHPRLPDLWVETKNVTMVEECVAQFPDAPSERARKHLVELMRLVSAGARAAIFFAVQRPDAHCFGPAWAVDEQYARLFAEACRNGVEAFAWEVVPGRDGYRLGSRLPLAPCLGGRD